MRTAGVVVLGAAVAVAEDDVISAFAGDYSTTPFQPTSICNSHMDDNICGDDLSSIGETMSVFNMPTGTVGTRDWTKFSATDLVQTSDQYVLDTPCTTSSIGCAYHPWYNGTTTVGAAAQVLPPALVGTNGADTTTAYYSVCLVQWNLGAMPKDGKFAAGSTPSSFQSTLQSCQTACIDESSCDLWSYDATVGDGTTHNCFLQTSDALATAVTASASDSDACVLAAGTGSPKWATCESDPTIKICATASGTTITGRKYCAEGNTPTLAYLQANAAVCGTQTSTGAINDNTVPNGAFAAIPVLGAALLIAATVYLF